MIILPEKEALTPHEAKQKSPVELAFIGDAVYEVMVREHIRLTHDAPAGKLHNICIGYVRAEAQHEALEKISGLLSEEEAEIARRGRNANKVTSSKHADPSDYRAATGLEALFGFLYLTGRTDRIRELFTAIISEDDV